MATQTGAEFLQKWTSAESGPFANNEMEKITEATFRDFAADNLSLHERGPNHRAAGNQSVIFLTQADADAAGRGYCATLEGLTAEGMANHFLYAGMTVRVDLHPDQYGQEMELVWDGRQNAMQGIRAYVDGSLTPYPQLTGTADGLNPAQWIKKGSNRSLPGNVPLLDPQRRDYPAGYLVQSVVAGEYYLFRTKNPGGPFPSPYKIEGNADWLPVAKPGSQVCTLEYAQKVLMPTNSVQVGVQYAITGPWNGSFPNQTVFLFGVTPSTFEAVGTLEKHDGELADGVKVDVLASKASTFGDGAKVKVDGVTIVQNPDGTLSAVSAVYLFVTFKAGGGYIQEITIQNPVQVGKYAPYQLTPELNVYDIRINGVSQGSSTYTVALGDQVTLFANVPVGGAIYSAIKTV